MDYNELVITEYPHLEDLEYIEDIEFREDLSYPGSEEDIPGFRFRGCKVQCMNGQCGIAEISNNDSYFESSKEIDEIARIVGYTLLIISGGVKYDSFEIIKSFRNKRTNNLIHLQSKNI